jgi:hypothetical protein
MPLNVLCRAQYLTRSAAKMRGVDYDATHMVKAVKGLPLNPNAYSRVLIGDRGVTITEANKDRAIDWFAEWAAGHINARGAHRKIIVPVPSSKSTLKSPPNFRTAVIAQKIASLCVNTLPFPSLRFESERPNSREEGGSRSASALYPAMRLAAKLPAGELILLDDVLTGGGHLRAAAWKLEDAGSAVQLALCCGRSLEAQLDDPFSVAPETVDITRP